MMNRHFSFLVLFLLAAHFLWFSCAGKPAVEEPEQESGQLPQQEAFPGEEPAGLTEDFLSHPGPGDLIFLPASFPALMPAPGVGVVSRERRGASLTSGERAALQDSFRAAYVDGLLRGLPLEGVLGGDQVHGWPETNPSGWVQNWRSARPVSNSWGISSLILAVQGVEIQKEMAQDRVFIVDGEILNYYGVSSGLGGANGDMGYGSPRGEKFAYNDGIAQRFDLGLIVIDQEGQGSFLPGEPPSAGLSPPPETGVFPGAPQADAEQVRDAFFTAWKMALDRNIETMVPDGPGRYLSLSGAFLDPASPESGEVKGVYIQTFNRRSALLILIESPVLPFHVRFITSPFLELLLFPERYSLQGSESLSPVDLTFRGEDDFARRLMGGIAFYGFPLTDPLPYKTEGDSSWQETQRFSTGFISGRPRAN
jgi:hypothetical protein